MRNSLDDTMVELEGCLDEILAIARTTRSKDSHTGIGRSEPGVEPLEPLLDRQDWIAAIGDIIIIDDTPLGAEHNDLGGGGTRIDAQKSIEDGDILARFCLHLTEVLLERLRIGNQSVEVVGRELAARHPVQPGLIVVSTLEDRCHGTGRRAALCAASFSKLLNQASNGNVFFRRDDRQGCAFGRE